MKSLQTRNAPVYFIINSQVTVTLH